MSEGASVESQSQRWWRRTEASREERYYRPFVLRLRMPRELLNNQVTAGSRTTSGSTEDSSVEPKKNEGWVELKIEQRPMNLDPYSCGSTVWDASILLAKHLEHMTLRDPAHLRHKRVLELGSGCGLVSCCLATLGAGQVVATDYNRPSVLELLTRNLRSNLSQAQFDSVTVQGLRWGDEEDIERIRGCCLEADGEQAQEQEGMGSTAKRKRRLRTFDLIVASDVIYEVDLSILLASTLESLVFNDNEQPKEGDAGDGDGEEIAATSIIIAQQDHNSTAELAFLREMEERGFEWRSLDPTNELPPGFQDPDVWIRRFAPCKSRRRRHDVSSSSTTNCE